MEIFSGQSTFINVCIISISDKRMAGNNESNSTVIRVFKPFDNAYRVILDYAL